MQVLHRPPSGFPALVLNADFRPLSYYPLSLWPWEEAVKAVYADRRYGDSLKRFMERNIYGTFRPGSQKVKRRLF